MAALRDKSLEDAFARRAARKDECAAAAAFDSGRCLAAYDNAAANGDLAGFYERCATEGGSSPLRSECSLCCDAALRDAFVDSEASLRLLGEEDEEDDTPTAPDSPTGDKKSSKKGSGPSATTVGIAVGIAVLVCALLAGALAMGWNLGGGVPLTPGHPKPPRRFRPFSGRRRPPPDEEAGLRTGTSDDGSSEPTASVRPAASSSDGEAVTSDSSRPSSDELPKDPMRLSSGDLSLWRRQGRAFAWGERPRVAWPDASDRFVRRLRSGHGIELVDAVKGFRVAPVDRGLREALAEACAWPLARRVEEFRRRLDGLRGHWQRDGRLTVPVVRETALGSCYDLLARAPDAQWRWPWFFEIEGEPGLDAGGLSREVMRLATTELFSIEVGLFTHANDDTMTLTLCDDATVAAQEGVGPAMLTFAGKLVGKALLDGIHLDAQLNPCLLKHVCGVPVGLADLQDLDWPLFSSLSQLEDVDVTDLALTFAVETRAYGAFESHELVPGGADVAVTQANKHEFIALRLREALFETSQRNLEAFLRGIYAVIPQEYFLLVGLMLSGTPTIDVGEWAAATHYRGAFTEAGAAHPVAAWFWEALGEFPADRRAQLLQWATGHARVPVQGWDHLMGRDGVIRPFTLTSIELDQACYPRAHTCFNRIDVPLFASKADLVDAFSFVLDLDDKTFQME